MAAKINYKTLQKVAQSINDMGEVAKIKFVGIQKEDLFADVGESYIALIESGCDIPDDVRLFCEKHFGDEDKVADKIVEEGVKKEKSEPVCTLYGNTMETLKPVAEALKVSTDCPTPKSLEDNLLEKLDSLTQEEWDVLPKDIQNWDVEMTQKIQDAKAAKIEAEQKAKKPTKPEEKADVKTKKETAPRKKNDPGEARPDFTFTPGTNAFQVMEIFGKLFKKSKGEGVRLKDLQAACEAEEIKSSNPKSRAAAVINYATTANGGSQVFKEGDLIFPKGHENK
jgi:hypothetical protein